MQNEASEEASEVAMSLTQTTGFIWRFIPTLMSFVILLSSCRQQKIPKSVQITFSSPDDAAKALVTAAKSSNTDAISSVLGPGSKDIISSADAEQDKIAFTGFVSDYDVMHRWRKMEDGTELLVTGTDNKVFPVPLRKNSTGQWYFDIKAGKDEILARRIGKNETAAIDTCGAIGDAEQQYFSNRHDGVNQYAQRFISDEGKQNGLYWSEANSQPKSPLGPLVAFATAEGYKAKQNQHQPFYGYYFAILDKQGPNAKGGSKNYIVDGKMTKGFALVAYPAEYPDSGIMTFLMNQDGTVLQKDLGTKTDEIASAMTEFNPDQTWTAVERN